MEISEKWIIVIFTFSSLTLATPLTGSNHFPFFHETERNITVRTGDLAILKCTIENLGPKMVVWRKLGAGYPLTIGEMVYSANDKIDIQQKKGRRGLDHWNLIIKRVDPSDAGQYECQVSSAQAFVYLVQLTVIDSPPKESAGLTLEGRNIVNDNEPINLTCLVKGEYRTPEDVDWFFNGDKILPGKDHWSRVYITREREPYRREFKSHLLIDKSDLSDRGVYVCRASDNLQLVKSITISVLEVPTPKQKKNRDVTGNSNRGKFISDRRNNSSNVLRSAGIHLTLIIQLMVLLWTR
ncbi:limbic system-associated membrane protein-like isoform X2 [Ostrea edulis]|uniref:limbic system-associated membrane protein-like isoform X2 n=1 Tax=Ostrea edulis TaxID=37623 RepID=UPI0024AE928C|nr:limbic system-associated membrane protein-like isoform X2 [Ostrea edulis]